MENYKNRIVDEVLKKKLKGKMEKFFIFLLVFLCLILSYILYDKTQITQSNLNSQNVTVERTTQTLEEVKENNRTVTGMIAEINNSVVGISKVKNTGSSIFSDENITSLGLGTGLIVGENGYILTNAHVSGEKYSKCYVTLEDGKTYDGNVVWSNTDIDMSIVKIEQKKLQVATLAPPTESRQRRKTAGDASLRKNTENPRFWHASGPRPR